MYNSYFGFSDSPFENNLDQKFLVLSESHKEVLAALLYFVRQWKGFALVCGDVGTGKTMLINSYLQRLPPNVHPIFVSNPDVEYSEILQYIALKLHIGYTTTNILSLIDQTKDALIEADRSGERFVLIIDEAHLLSDRSLEHIRLLSNIEIQQRKLLQILLVGQYELSYKLSRPEMRQLRQRININRFLEPLSFWETTEYVNHRLKVVGAKFDSCFEKNCKRLLHKMTRGVPRHINQLCDNALLICKALGYKKVNRKVLIKADRALRSDLLLTPNTPLIRRIPRVHSLIRRLALAGLPLIVLILAAILGYYGYLGANLHRVIDRGLAHLSSSSLETISSNAVTRSFVKEKLIVTDIKSPVSSNKQLQAKAMEGRFADFESGQTRPKSPVNDETESIKKSNLHDIGNTNSKHSSQPVVPDLVEKPQQSSLSSADNENVSEIVNEVEETPFESQLTEFTNALIDDNADSKNPGDQTSSTRKRVGPIEISIRQIEDLIVLNHWSATQADNTALVKQRNFTTPFRRIEVKKNESVGAIATRWFPDDPWSGVAAILSANRDIVDKNRIYPGQVLILPDLVSSRKAVEVVDNLYYAPYASFQSLKKLRNAMQWLSEKSIEYVVENQASFDGIPYFQINLKGYNQTNESKRAIESGNKSEQ